MFGSISHKGFTLVEIAIVLIIVSVLLGYTVAMFPRQQELKQYNAVDRDMDRMIEAIIGFAQVNGRLPCPAIPNTAGVEDYDFAGDTGCNNFGGFVPVNTLGLSGRVNQDSLLLDPWGNPYRYYVSDSDFDGDGNFDFVSPGEMRDIGLIDSDGDGYIDLDGNYMICDDNGTSLDDQCTGAVEVFGNYFAGPPAMYAGAPAVLLSPGKNWPQWQPTAPPPDNTPDGGAVNDELENIGGNFSSAAPLSMAAGPSGLSYTLKDVAGGETTFVRRTTGFADDYNDIVVWISPSVLFSRMIQAEQLP